MSRPRDGARRALLFSFCTLATAPALAVDPAFEVCLDDVLPPPLGRVVHASDVASVRIDALFAEGYGDAAAMVAGDTWDVSAALGRETVIQWPPVDRNWSCSVGASCPGLDPSAADSIRVEEQVLFGDRDVWGFSDGGDRLLLDAFIGDEGQADEIRYCSDRATPWWVFPRPGACAGDGDPPWSTTLGCAVVLNQGDPCGVVAPDTGADGEVAGRVARAGTLTLPSGHVLDALLVEAFVQFDIVTVAGPTCLAPVDSLSQYLHAWLVPYYGPILQVFSPDTATDLRYQVTDSARVGFGLLPPIEVQGLAATDTTIEVQWVPGTGQLVDEWIVHWGEQPGSVVAPTDSSEARGDTIPVGQTSYLIDRLDPSTTYYISVTSRSAYTDSVSGVTTTYDSIQLPASIGADIDGDGVRDTSYPPELQAMTTGAAPIALLRSWFTSIDPVIPARSAALPLESVRDAYLPSVTSGDEDLDPDVFGDPTRRLVVYALDASGPVLRLVKTATPTVRFDF